MCDGHLVDGQFAIAVIDEDVKASKTKLASLESQVASLKTSIDNQKKANKGYFSFIGIGGKKKTDEKEVEKSKEEIRLEKDEELLAKLQETRDAEKITAERLPRTFNLTKEFYSMRIMNRRNALMAKQNQQKLRQPDLFPKAPTHVPGQETSTTGSTPPPPPPPASTDTPPADDASNSG